MRSELFENELKKQCVTFVYEEHVPLEAIDAKLGLRNQARLDEPLDEALVESYAQAKREGSDFPPLVVYPKGRNRFVPMDGNQRLAAYNKLGLKDCDCYIVTCPDEMVRDRISWSFNNHVNGARISMENALLHAVGFVRKYGYTVEAAAKEWGVHKQAVHKKCRVFGLKDVLNSNNIKHNLSDETLYQMGHIETLGEDLFIASAKAVINTGALANDVADLSKKIKKSRTHADKLTTIAEFESSDRMVQRYAETKGGTVKRKTLLPRDTLAKKIEEALRLVDAYPDRKAFLPSNKADTKTVRRNAADLCQKLSIIFGLGSSWQEETA